MRKETGYQVIGLSGYQIAGKLIVSAVVCILILLGTGYCSLGTTPAYALSVKDAVESETEKKERKKEIARHYKSGVKYYKKNDPISAVEEFKMVLSIDSEHKRAKQQLTRIQRRLQELIPEPGFSRNKGIEYYIQGEYVSAIGQWKKVLILDPIYEGVTQYIKKAQEKLKEMAEAKRAREREARAKEKQRKIAWHYKKGYDLYRKGNLKGAMKEFRIVLRLDPKHKKAEEYLAKLDAQLTPRAKTKTKPVVVEEPGFKPTPKIDPAEVAKHYNKGIGEYQSGHLTAAIKEWEKVLELDPTHEKAQKNIEEVKRILESLDKR